MARREAEVRRALEDGEVLGLRRDRRCGLDAARARADEPDALPGEVDAFARPRCRVVRRHRRSSSSPGMSGAIGADRHPTAVTRKRAVTVSSSSVRISQRFVESSNVAAVTRVESCDVAAQIEAIGDVVEVPLDLGLLRVPTRPLPLLRQLAARTSSSSSSSRSRSARPGSDSSTTCRRRRRRPRRRGRSGSGRRGACGARRGRRSPRRSRPTSKSRLIIHRSDRIRRSPPPTTGIHHRSDHRRRAGPVSGRFGRPQPAGRGVGPATGPRPGAR